MSGGRRRVVLGAGFGYLGAPKPPVCGSGCPGCAEKLLCGSWRIRDRTVSGQSDAVQYARDGMRSRDPDHAHKLHVNRQILCCLGTSSA